MKIGGSGVDLKSHLQRWGLREPDRFTPLNVYPACPVESDTLWVFNWGGMFTPLNPDVIQLGRSLFLRGVDYSTGARQTR